MEPKEAIAAMYRTMIMGQIDHPRKEALALILSAAEKWDAIEYGADEYAYGMTLDKDKQLAFKYADGVRNIIFDLLDAYRKAQEGK